MQVFTSLYTEHGYCDNNMNCKTILNPQMHIKSFHEGVSVKAPQNPTSCPVCLMVFESARKMIMHKNKGWKQVDWFNLSKLGPSLIAKVTYFPFFLHKTVTFSVLDLITD